MTTHSRLRVPVVAVCNGFRSVPQRAMWTHRWPYTITRLLQAAKPQDELIEFVGGHDLRPRTALDRGEDPDQSRGYFFRLRM